MPATMTMTMSTNNNTAVVDNSSRPAVLKPSYDEKAQLQQQEDGNDTETTCDETESCYEEEEEGCDQQQQYPPAEGGGGEEEEGEYYMYDGDEYTYEEYTVVDDEYEHGTYGVGNGTTCGDEYTYVTLHDELQQREINVRFHPSLTIHLIPTRSEFSSKERKRYWTSSEEKQKTERRLSKTVNRMIAREQAQAESASSSSGRHHHQNPRHNQNIVDRRYRGLENFSMKGDYNCGELIRTMINSVMDEQDRQWLADETDETRIAEISQSISYDNILKAQLTAKHDEEDAIHVYSRDPETFFDGYYKQANATVTADDKVDCETSSSSSSSLCHKIQKKVTIRKKKQLQRNQRKSSRRLVGPDPQN